MGAAFKSILAVGGLILAVGLGALAIYVVHRWYRSAQEPPIDTSGLLSKFRELHRRGELTDEEFSIIRSRLGEQLREELMDAEERRTKDR